MTAIIERQRAPFYIQKKQKKCQTFLNAKTQKRFQKARQFPLRYIYKKPYILLYTIFHGIFEVGIYIQKA